VLIILGNKEAGTVVRTNEKKRAEYRIQDSV
jgi:hypothetical protein